MEVVSQETVDADEYTGQTVASEVVEVRSRVFGYLKSVDFKDDNFDTEGQTLFQNWSNRLVRLRPIASPKKWRTRRAQVSQRLRILNRRLQRRTANAVGKILH